MQASDREFSYLDEAVSRIKRLVQGRGTATSEDLDAVLGWLEQLVTHAYPAIAQDAADIADEAVVRFIQAIRRGLLHEGRPSAAYLTTIAKNEALSRLRSRPKSPPSHRTGEDDPAIYAFLDRQTAKHEIDDAWLKAIRRRDATVVRVVASWLDLSAQLGRVPTTREVGRVAKVSHTAVRLALQRFKSYFPEGTHPA